MCVWMLVAIVCELAVGNKQREPTLFIIENE